MAISTQRDSLLTYKGSSCLRMRLMLSILSGKTVKITDIRSLDDEPGLREYEVNLIRLLDKITNGTTIEVNETGTSLVLQPGLLQGGSVTHECCKLKPISFYLEVLLALAVFCKTPLNCVLTGVTDAENEVSIDNYISGALPVLKHFLGVDEGLKLAVSKRGMMPEGGGQVTFQCPVRKQLRPVQLCDMGKVCRVRGVVYAVRVSPAIANRMVEAAKGILLNYLPDVYIHTDHCRGANSGKSPGFGISLHAETTSGVVLTSQCCSGNPPGLPEDLAQRAASLLLHEVHRGGCVTSSVQSLTALWMCLTSHDVNKLLSGPLTPYTIKFLQHLRDFFGLTFKLEARRKEDEEEDELEDGGNKVMLTCVGLGYTNINRRVL